MLLYKLLPLGLAFGILQVALRLGDDAGLVRRLKAREPKAMNDLYDRYGRLAYSIIFRMVRNPSTAEDLVQETFLRMLRYQAIENPGERRALLFRVAASVVADRRRHAKSRRENDHCALDGQELISDVPQPDRNLANHQHLVSLQRAILALPPRCREVFLLHRFEGLSYRDIARRFGTSERTVENQISHALAVCRRALA